jgi:hypothetical protein
MRSMSRQLLRPSTAITKTWSLHWCQIWPVYESKHI